MAEPCPHIDIVESRCQACGICLHDVVLNGACFYCGETALDPVAMSPKFRAAPLIPPAQLIKGRRLK